MNVDLEYIQLCIDEMNAISEASIALLREQLADDGPPWSVDRLNRRRAELYREHLDAAGIILVRKDASSCSEKRHRIPHTAGCEWYE